MQHMNTTMQCFMENQCDMDTDYVLLSDTCKACGTD